MIAPDAASGGWSLSETRERDRILRILQADRVFAAYAIGDLDPALFDHCQWVVAEHQDGRTAAKLLFKGFEPPAIVLIGDPVGVSLALGAGMHPTQAYAVFAGSHRPALEAHYALADAKQMLRMVWDDTESLPSPNPQVFRLSEARLAELQNLYRLYADACFSPYQLAQGIFYGIERDGRLVSTAGTHLVSRSYGVAAVGNVFTHPDHRGRGYARACAAEVLRELRGQVETVVLNVGVENLAAQHIYRALGFAPHCNFIEAMAHRRM